MSNEQELSPDEPFITKVLALCLEPGGGKNRGNCAKLRRYWSPSTRHYAYPLLGRLSVLDRKPDALTAALFAEYPEHSPSGLTIGKAALRLAGGSRNSSGFEAFERHFRRLLGCDGSNLEEIGAYLHRMILRLKGSGLKLNYNQILWDLRRWRSSDEDVKIRWACDFWQAPIDSLPSQP